MKLLFTLILSGVVSGAFADDMAAVVERQSCADISSQISKIGAMEKPSQQDSARLQKLKADYRKMCARSGQGRRTTTSAYVPASDENDDALTEVAEPTVEETVAVTVETTTDAVVSENNETVAAEPKAPVAELPALTPEQELANLDAGLCADGSQPNRFGCCGDEVFKDLGNTVFACCPKEGNGDCFPPLK